LAQRAPRSERDRTRTEAHKDPAATDACPSVALLRLAEIEQLLSYCRSHSLFSSC
jgi:hypothetical protein